MFESRRSGSRALALACALALPCAPACAPNGRRADKKRAILVSLDTLRADHMSLYGYARGTTPEMRALARDAAVFERAYAQASWTLPSHMSIFTSLYPEVHRLTIDSRTLPDGVPTLPSLLHDAGCATAAFTDGGYVAAAYGFGRGFDEFHDETFEAESGKSGLARTFPFAAQWLSEHADEDFFLFLHTYDTHMPYTVPEPYLSAFRPTDPPSKESVEELEYLASLEDTSYGRLESFEGMEHLVATYDGTILYADHMMGQLVALLRQLDIYDDTLLVITSDHGESFLDEGVYTGHGGFLNDAEVHVPLIVKFPGRRFADQRCGELVESIDILPTMLAALGVAAPPGTVLQGQDLSLVLGGDPDPSPMAYSGPAGMQHAAVRSKDWTYVEAQNEGAIEDFIATRLKDSAGAFGPCRMPWQSRLTRSGDDPRSDQSARFPDERRDMEASLQRWSEGLYHIRKVVRAPGLRAKLSTEEIEYLKQLGYL